MGRKLFKTNIFTTGILMIFIMAAVCLSCERIFPWEYENEHLEIPVVEGIITNEYIHHTIKLSKVRANPNEQNLDLTGALVSVKFGTTVYQFAAHDSLPGTYIAIDPFIGFPGQTYRLEILYNGTTYHAVDKLEPVSPSSRAFFLPSDHDSTQYFLVANGSILYTPEPAMWEFLIRWDFLPEYADIHPDSCRARLFYYDLKLVEQGQIFAPPQQTVFFPKGAVVYQTKYALSEEHKKFRRSLLLETEWRGGLMDVSPGSVYTNVSNGGLGFFGASAVVRDTFYIQ